MKINLHIVAKVALSCIDGLEQHCGPGVSAAAAETEAGLFWCTEALGHKLKRAPEPAINKPKKSANIRGALQGHLFLDPWVSCS